MKYDVFINFGSLPVKQYWIPQTIPDIVSFDTADECIEWIHEQGGEVGIVNRIENNPELYEIMRSD